MFLFHVTVIFLCQHDVISRPHNTTPRERATVVQRDDSHHNTTGAVLQQSQGVGLVQHACCCTADKPLINVLISLISAVIHIPGCVNKLWYFFNI